jgi:hypothetical protein
VSQYLYSFHLSCEQTSNDNAIYDGEELDLFEMDENTRDDGDDDSENYDNHFTTRQEYMHLNIVQLLKLCTQLF